MITAATIGSELRALRLARGLSQKRLARRLGISAGQVSQIETGVYVPSLDAISLVLDALDARLTIVPKEGA